MITLAGHGKDERLIMAPEDTVIVERAAEPVLVEKEISKSLPEQTFKVGDRVYQGNPDNIGIIITISRGKALVNVGGDRQVKVPIEKLHHCDPNYSPKPKKSAEEILAEEEAAIAKARDGYLKSQQVIEGDENYTPEYFLAPCKEFLGIIDLDPFSCFVANKTVEAMRFWTREDDALAQDWSDYFSKWVNPPYSAGLIGKAIAKTLEYCHIGETLLLVNTSSSAKWFQACMEKCSAYLHPSKRINFDSPFRTSKGNRYDQTLFYFGDRPLQFAEALSSLGNAVQPIKKSSCLPTTTGLEALEPSVMQPESPAKLKQSDTLISAKMLKPSTVQTSLKSQSLETLERSLHQQESISLLADSPAQEPQTQEPKQDYYIQSLLSGLNISELSTKDGPASLSSKTQLQLLITHCEQYLEDSEWSDIVGTIHKSYKLLSLEVPKNGSDYLSLDTLTSNKGVKSRSSGQSKCEKWFRDKGLLLDTQCLSPQMMAVLFGFPMEWTKCLWDVQGVQTGDLDLDICLEEPSTLTAVQQSLNESCISIAVSTVDIDEANLGNSDHAIATKPSESVAISRIDDALVESSNVRALDVLVESKNVRALDERLAYLQSERDRLISSGACPDGVWINCSEVSGKKFKQAVWKCTKPRPEWDGNKSKYIGEFGKEAHISAIAQHRAGQELRKIEREIRKLQDKKS
jgi:hypothetical protein